MDRFLSLVPLRSSCWFKPFLTLGAESLFLCFFLKWASKVHIHLLCIWWDVSSNWKALILLINMHPTATMTLLLQTAVCSFHNNACNIQGFSLVPDIMTSSLVPCAVLHIFTKYYLFHPFIFTSWRKYTSCIKAAQFCGNPEYKQGMIQWASVKQNSGYTEDIQVKSHMVWRRYLTVYSGLWTLTSRRSLWSLRASQLRSC